MKLVNSLLVIFLLQVCLLFNVMGNAGAEPAVIKEAKSCLECNLLEKLNLYDIHSLSSIFDNMIFYSRNRQLLSNFDANLLDNTVDVLWNSYKLRIKFGFLPSIFWLIDDEKLSNNGFIFLGSGYQLLDNLMIGFGLSVNTENGMSNINLPGTMRMSSENSIDISGKSEYIINGNMIYNLPYLAEMYLGLFYIYKKYSIQHITSLELSELFQNSELTLHNVSINGGMNFNNISVTDYVSITNSFNTILNFNTNQDSKVNLNSNFKIEYKLGWRHEFDLTSNILALNPYMIIGYNSSFLSSKASKKNGNDYDKLYFGTGLSTKIVSFNAWDIDLNFKFLYLQEAIMINVGINLDLGIK